MQLTPETIRSFAQSNLGTTWETEGQSKPFSFEISASHITFLISTGNRRPVSLSDLHRFCESYNLNRSLRPVDYTGVTHNASYLLAIVREITSESEGKPLIASDLDVPIPDRVQSWVCRIVRDTKLAKRIKALHNDVCQVCGGTIECDDSRYSEAHHIQPLGGTHKGPDVMGNLLCVCPNCHAKCDLGVIRLDLDGLRCAVGHVVDSEYIDYHNGLHGFRIDERGITK